MAYKVEFYLQRYSKRIAGICQWEAQRKALDSPTIHREATALAMNTQDTYDDAHGTNGFIRWFTKLTSDLCLFYLDNRDEYSSVLRGKKFEPKEIKIGEYVKQDTDSPTEKSVETKHCNKCDSDKPLDEFHNNKANKDGKNTVCKECMKKYWTKPKENRGHVGTELTPIADSPAIKLTLDIEEIEVLIQMYAEKLQQHLESTGKETERLTMQIQKWTAFLNKRKST